jgi:hypothetical protein
MGPPGDGSVVAILTAVNESGLRDASPVPGTFAVGTPAIGA